MKKRTRSIATATAVGAAVAAVLITASNVDLHEGDSTRKSGGIALQDAAPPDSFPMGVLPYSNTESHDPASGPRDQSTGQPSRDERINTCPDDKLCLYRGEGFTGEVMYYFLEDTTKPGFPTNLTDFNFSDGAPLNDNVRSIVNNIRKPGCLYLEKDVVSSGPVDWPTGLFVPPGARMDRIDSTYSAIIFYGQPSFQCGHAEVR
ncbi:peptidase inhibitor family I36 protein [Streptomyces sp. NPDC026665]|uniref:peptidase inhibitor family I36 protein n=1 Tax=Streptomyces sp. NPDC026665 TaxID=3154798 RepID=UPI0033DEF8AB